MDTIPVKCDRIERAAYSRTNDMLFRVTFRVGTDREYFDIPIWVDDASVAEGQALQLAQSTFHDLMSQLSQQTITWARPAI